jgi:NAD(P)-dependent dehydrogenase (short-subunit alcohol dehydrogenase family)
MTETRVVLVTGASTGIGRATAVQLIGLGFTVFAGVRKPTDAEALSAAGAIPLTLDVTDATQIAAAIRTITEHGAGLFAVVNNAGIATAAPLEFVPINDFRQQLEVNVTGQLAVAQAALPLLRAARGRIVNVTSIAGLISGPMLGRGIQVTAIEPGKIATPIWASSAAHSDGMLADSVDASTKLYGERIAGARTMAASASTTGIPPERVAEVIGRALMATRMRHRYPVGTDAKIGSAIIRRLPTRLRDRLMVARRSG